MNMITNWRPASADGAKHIMKRMNGDFLGWIIDVNGNTKPWNLEDESNNIDSLSTYPGDNKN